MSKKLKLTKRAVDGLIPPSNGSDFEIYWDTELPCFGVRVTKAGAKSYILQYRTGGRQRRMTIGRHGVYTAEQARSEAVSLLGDISKGNDPQADKHKERSTPTFGTFSHEYLQHAKSAKKTWQKDEAQLKLRILPKLGMYRLDAIETRQIEELHLEIRQELSPATANRYLALIRRMFNLAVRWGYISQSPAQSIKSFKENNQKTDWLSAEQVAALLKACADYENPYVGALFPFLLFTGARVGEALAAQWKNVDLERAMWLIPEAKSGNGRYVPLSPQAVEQLRAIPRQLDSQFVFCGHKHGRPLVNVSKPWGRIKKGANLPEHFRVHDLRHTFASWGASKGIDLYHLQSLLGHSSSAMTQRYSHLAESGIKASVNHIGDHITTASKEHAGLIHKDDSL